MTRSRGIRVRRGTRQQWVEDNQGKHFCGCGCGGEIKLIATHFNTGIPTYLLGHNTRIYPVTPRGVTPRKEKPPATPCECGCGALASPGKRFLVGHSSRGRKMSEAGRQKLREANSGERNHHYGKRSTNWKGGRTTTPAGYIAVWAPDHPRARGRYLLEHRLLVEQDLQANDPGSEYLDAEDYLHRGVDVHHVNGVKNDNRLTNLQPMWRSEHTRVHAAELNHARWPKAS